MHKSIPTDEAIATNKCHTRGYSSVWEWQSGANEKLTIIMEAVLIRCHDTLG